MRRAHGHWPAIAVTAVVLGLLVLGTVSIWGSATGEAEAELLMMGGTITALLVIGGLLAARRPENAVGWLLLASGVFWTILSASDPYAQRGLVESPGSLPGAGFALWLATWTWMVGILVLPGVLLHFPDGELPSPRWRPVRTAWVLGFVGVVVAQWTVGWGAGGYDYDWMPTGMQNPMHLPALEGARSALARGAGVVLALAVLGSLASVVVRFRRAVGAERQQMKWVVFGVTAAAALVLLNIAVETISVALTGRSPFAYRLDQILFGLMLASFPFTIGLAVLRYRLYDIDRIVSRTVSYLALTVVLVGLYVAGVVGIGSLVRRTLGEASNDLVVAASTLIVAAAFGPVRHRVQALVDRRFNRARYNAALTVDSFALRLRDELDLETLTAELRDVVSRSLQPVSATVSILSEEVHAGGEVA